MSSKNGNGKKAKQMEMDGMPSTELRDKILEAIEIKDDIGERANQMREVMDDVRKMMREDKRKSITIEDNNGLARTVNLVSTGEKVKISNPKKAKDKSEKAEEEIAA